jgi:hypothetical protein
MSGTLHPQGILTRTNLAQSNREQVLSASHPGSMWVEASMSLRYAHNPGTPGLHQRLHLSQHGRPEGGVIWHGTHVGELVASVSISCA